MADEATMTPEQPTSEWVLMSAEDAKSRTVYQRMLAILEELPAIGKDTRNVQQNFMYRAHDDVMAALNPLLAKYGVFVVPRVVDRIASAERTTSNGKTMYEVNLHVEFTFYGAGGDSVVASAWGEGTDMGDKSTNKAMTGAFKNALAQAFALSTHELSDADAGSPEHTTSGGPRSTAAPERAVRRSPASRGFDPGIDLMDGAVSGDGFLKRLGEQLQAIHPDIDWSGTVQPLMYERFGATHVSELSDEQAGEYWRRFANAAAKINEAAPPGQMPPATEGQIKEGIAWAFSTKPESVTLMERQPTEEELAAAEQAREAAGAD